MEFDPINLCPPYPDCLINQEPFTDENNNGIWDEDEPFEDTNENGIYEEDYVGYQDTSECIEYQLGDVNMDETIDILDIILGISLILGNTDSTDYELNVLDFNQDGLNNVIDIVGMINYILEL